MALFSLFRVGDSKGRSKLVRKPKHGNLREAEIHPQEESHFHAEKPSNLGFKFQIFPEAITFLSTYRKYPTKFRHVNCAQYGTPNYPPIDCSGAAYVHIPPPGTVENNVSPQWMQVCPGGCNKESGASAISDSNIIANLYRSTRAMCEVLHPQEDQFFDVVNARIIWAENSPTPAYFHPSRGDIVAHSSKVTSGHLALMQARGCSDSIQIDFRTYEMVPIVLETE
ncbi:hypothetical protein F5Y07DRAFT_397912 [Xylaria sp. FL0933]|nr:hypothetical protein F5Y07DRAFT_397912 [Xylaria sp. FL0933]